MSRPSIVGDELIEAIERGLASAPVVPVRPVGGDVLHVHEWDSLRPVVDVLTIRPPGVQQPHAQVVEHRFGHVDREGSHLVSHAHTVFAVANAEVLAWGYSSYDATVNAPAREYDDIPGTYVFDGRRSRRGYALNMFCMSLNDAANREAFRADEAALPRPLRPRRPSSAGPCAERDWLRLLELGGNIYYTFKLAACDGMTFQDLAGEQTGITDDEYVGMMVGRRPSHRRQPLQPSGDAGRAGGALMAEIVGGVGMLARARRGRGDRQGPPATSRTGRRTSPRSTRSASGSPSVRARRLHRRLQRPRLAFSLEVIPTFALGLAAEFPLADEGYGRRPVPTVEGHPELAWHLAESLILDEFDLTLVNEMAVDHGLHRAAVGAVRPARGVAVPGDPAVRQRRSSTRRPPATAATGSARRSAGRSTSYPGDERVVILGTGGMSHQLQARAGRPDQRRLRHRLPRPAGRRPRGGRRGSRTSSTSARRARRASSW